MNEIIKEHFGFRKQILKMAKADLIKTYKGAALGWVWAIVKPATTIVVYWFAFSFGLRAGGDKYGHDFFFWLLCGIVPWFYMSEMIRQGTAALYKYKYLVTKMRFPVSTVPTFVSLSKLFVHIVLVVVTIAILLLNGYKIDIYYLQLPFYMILLFLFFTFWTLLAAPLAAVSKDFLNLIKSIITAIFWGSGILWDPKQIDIPWLKSFLMLNPVTYFSNGYRNVFLYKIWFWEEKESLFGILLVLLLLIVISVSIYRRLRKEIPDVL